MKIVKKIGAFFLAVILAASGFLELAPLEAYTVAASSKTQISNKYMQYTLNRATGGFSIDTLEGHPQKKYDDNTPLLYKESNEGMETSYITLRVKDDSEAGYTDYIWGQDYSWLLGEGQGTLDVSEPKEDGDAIMLEADWSILGLTVTQTVALSTETEGNSNNTGNLGVSYTIQNNSSKPVEAGLRILLDTALSNEIDAPYLMTGDNDYVTVEKEYKDSAIPTQIRGVDSLYAPTRMCYAIFDGWEGKKVDRVIQGHWANLANSRYAYEPDDSCDFTNRSNKYVTADSAMALYWDDMNIPAGDKSDQCQFLYGVGNFSQELSDKKVNINMTVGNVKLAEDGSGYADDGIFTVEATIDNNTTISENLTAPSMSLNLEEGLTLVKEEMEGYETTDTFNWNEIEAGQMITKKFRVKAAPQQEITAKAVSISLNTTNKINERASRYVVLPNAMGEAAKVKFSSVTPEKIYTEGDRSFALAGEFSALEALRGNSGWALKLVSTIDGTAYEVDKKDISFDREEWKSINAIVREELPVGMYKIVFEFNNNSPELIKAFGKVLDSNLKLEVSADPALKDPNYGIISLVRYTQDAASKYVFVPFPSEEEYDAFLHGEKGARVSVQEGGTAINLQEYNYVDPKDSAQEVLVTLRGKAKKVPQENGASIKYVITPSDDGSNVTMNNCISCENNVELYYEGDSDARSAYIAGDGDIRVINSISFWKSEWYIEANENTKHTLSDPGEGQELQVSLGGAAQMIQSIGGMIVDLKYGVLTSEVLEDESTEQTGFGYGVSFGGSLSIPISIAEGKDKQQDPSGTPGASPSATPSSTPSNTPSVTPDPSATPKPDEGEYEPNDGSLLSADIENILYGEKSLKNYLNPSAAGAKADSGYIGTDVTVGVGLPENIMGKLVTNSKGAYATVHVDTIEGIYSVSAGMKVAILEVEGTLAFKTIEMDGVEKTLPDELAFNIANGLKVPIVAPTLFMTGIGGGISELADTIGGDYVEGLPPLTLSVQMAINAVEVLDGNFSAEISAFGMSLDGTIAPKGALKDVMEINGGLSARWIDPFYVNVYGNVDVLGIIKGGATITIKEDYFYGYAYVAIVIPEDIPLVGGKELAKIEAAISDRYVGANIKIIGIGLGVIYYYDSGDVDFGGDIDLGQAEEAVGASLLANEAVQVPTEDGVITFSEEDVLAIEEERVASTEGETEDCTIIVGSNLHKLTTKKSAASGRMLRNAPKAANGSNVSQLSWSVDSSGQDSLLMEIPFLGKAENLPDADKIKLTATGANETQIEIKLEEYSEENPEEGNLIIQHISEDENYLFITVNKELLEKLGHKTITWNLTVDAAGVNISRSRETLYGVDTLPELEAVTAEAMEETAESGLPKVKASWTVNGDKNYNGKLAAYLTKNRNVIEELKDETNGEGDGKTTEETADLGTLVWEENRAIENGTTEIILPDTIPSGDYYLVMTSSVDKAGATTAVSKDPITITNNNLPGEVEKAVLTAVGDQQLRLNITDQEDADYNEYYVELYEEDGELVTSGFHEVGTPIIFGKVIEAAVEDDPETPANEAKPEKTLEVGKSYYAVVKTSRLEKTELENTPEPTADESNIVDYTEKRYIGDGEVTADSVEVPDVNLPKLLSVETEGIPRGASGKAAQSNNSHVKAVYTFEDPVNFTLNLDGLDLTGLSSSEDMRVWTFEKDLEDGAHTLDFTARSAQGDTLRSKDSGDTIGFVVDTEAPMLAIGSTFRQNMEGDGTAGNAEDDKDAAPNGQDENFINVSSQSAVTDKDGKYEIIGHTEPEVDASYTGEGKVVIADDGTFTISGTAKFRAAEEVYQTETLTVKDKAGNENSVTVYIINGNIKYPDSLIITNNGKEIKETDGVKLIKMKAGETVNLKAVGYDKDGNVVVYDESRLLWDTMYESNMVNLKDGNVTAKGTGETAVKVVLPYSNVFTGETAAIGNEEQLTGAGDDTGTPNGDDNLAKELENTKKMGPEDFVKITVTDGSKRTISFGAGGGQGKGPESIRALSGTVITLPECTYTMEDGTAFEGWSDGTDIYPAGGSLVVPNESITLIAKWEGKELEKPRPPFDGGGGTPTETPTETPTPEPTLTPGDITGYTPKIKCVKNMSNQVKISWEKLSGADGYYVYKKLPGGKWERVERVSAKTNTYTFKKLKSVQKYYFTVKAYVKVGSGKYVYSDYMTNFRKQTRPEIPEISVKDKTHNTVTIQWKGVPRAKMYYIYQKNAKGKWEIIKKLKGTRRSYTVKGLESNKKYTFTVRAMSNKMPSEYPASLVPITLLEKPKVQANAIGGGKVEVTWTQIPKAEKYNVYYRVSGTRKWKMAKSLGAAEKSYTVSGLTTNRTYEFSVKGNAKVGKRLNYSKHVTNVRSRVR